MSDPKIHEVYREIIVPYKILLIVLALPILRSSAQAPDDYPIVPVPFPMVQVEDGFWSPRLQTNTRVTVPHVLDQCDATGRVDNFRKAAGTMEGPFVGWWFNDSDVYKAIEAAAYALRTAPDKAMEARVDSIIQAIAAAQEADGYIYSPRKTTDPGYRYYRYIGSTRWDSLQHSHELYDLGHLYEAAIAYHEATGKRTLLDVSVRSADLLLRVFGPGKLRRVPGHQEIEIGLTKLARKTGNEAYAQLARFFLDERGKHDGHPSYGEYAQDHRPVVDQREAVGHAVRALYMYSGMADVDATYADVDYSGPLATLWEDVVGKKTYITGGIGAAGGHEGFDVAFELPNLVAYCETCASIASVLWNQRMFLASGDAKYIDVLERTLYNGVLSGIGLNGREFFYDNPLESDGSHARSPWFAVACCPPNVARILPQVAGMSYAQRDDRIYANLFISGVGRIALSTDTVTITQRSDYPWDGKIQFTVDPGRRSDDFALCVRLPGWSRDEAIPFDLYRFLDLSAGSPILRVNGTPQVSEPNKGYIEVRRVWKAGDVVEVELPMPVRRVVSRNEVLDDQGKFALQRGPLVYCVEAIDVAGGRVTNLVVDDHARFTVRRDEGLVKGMIAVEGNARALHREATGAMREDDASFRAIPYFAWAHRGKSEMVMWLARTNDVARPLPPPTIASQAKASSSGGNAAAVNDQREPKNSVDRGVRYLHWWPKKGTAEWVQYEFADATEVSAVEVYWHDDTGIGECRVPASWQLFYRSGEEWKPVRDPSGFEVKKDRFNRTTFDPVTTNGLRLQVQLSDSLSAGIHEWRVE